jgi:hypothetical protein
MRPQLLVLAFASALPLTACGPDGEAYLRQAGWYEEDNLENQASLALDGIDLVYTTVNGTNFGVLTEPGWERMIEFSEATLGEDIGSNYCGDGCEGGFASTISLVRDDSETIVTYPMGTPPPVLDDLDGLIATIMGTMTNCVDSYEASIVGTCARLD